MPTLSPCGKFIHYHAPKTGGSWMAKTWSEAGGRKFDGAHDPYRGTLPKKLEARGMTGEPRPRVVATVRNPWDWYVSWYLHCLRSSNDAMMQARLKVYGGGSLAFRDVLYGATHMLPDNVGCIWSPRRPAPPRAVSRMEMLERGLFVMGLYTFTMNHHYEAGPDVYIATDRLNDAVTELTPGIALPEPYNVRRFDAAELGAVYDAESAAWVAAADAGWIKWGGWRPDTPTEWSTK